MTNIYFVRHAEPNCMNHDDLTRELSDKGMRDRKLVTLFLQDKEIDVVLSSPYKRAVDTVKDFADSINMKVEIHEDFRERRIDSEWIEDFQAFSKRQWEDFEYKRSDGECLKEVQQRNIQELTRVLNIYRDKNVVVGSHGTALSTIINYYDPTFRYEEFLRIVGLMPWVVKFTFDQEKCIDIQEYDLLSDINR